MKDINFFDGTEFNFLSNFNSSPVKFKEKIWPTSEHLFQAAKTLVKKQQEEIRLAETPGDAKFMGRHVTLRSDWKEKRYDIMLKFVRLKFRQNQDLKERLLKTGDAKLIEGNNWHDNIWGDCCCKKCKNIKGQNFLGKVLMQVRAEIVVDKIKVIEPSKEKKAKITDKVDDDYRLIEILMKGLYTEETAFRKAALELRRQFPSEEWKIVRLLRIPGEDNSIKVVFEIERTKEDVEKQ